MNDKLKNLSPKERIAELTPALLYWFESEKKNYPWREEATAYHVWISEIMLQQTRIEAALPYYLRFIRELPDVKSLSEVPEERLLKLWEGLGYYSRAKNLKKAACTMMESFGGELPQTKKELVSLPGIGAYTAGAIASIAFREPVSAVDGNVLRVLSRITLSDADIAKESTKKAADEMLTGILEEHVPMGCAGSFNQSLMELGERICIPNGEPNCSRCPVRAYCLAKEAGCVSRYPVKTPPKARRVESRLVILFTCGEKVYLRKRPDKGLLAGLWEFPNRLLTEEEERIVHSRNRLSEGYGRVTDLGAAKHIFSHVEWHMWGLMVALKEESDLTEAAVSIFGEQAETILSRGIWADAGHIRNDASVPNAFKAFLVQFLEK